MHLHLLLNPASATFSPDSPGSDDSAQLDWHDIDGMKMIEDKEEHHEVDHHSETTEQGMKISTRPVDPFQHGRTLVYSPGTTSSDASEHESDSRSHALSSPTACFSSRNSRHTHTNAPMHDPCYPSTQRLHLSPAEKQRVFINPTASALYRPIRKLSSAAVQHRTLPAFALASAMPRRLSSPSAASRPSQEDNLKTLDCKSIRTMSVSSCASSNASSTASSGQPDKEKRFCCNYPGCDKAFARKFNLTTHYVSLSGRSRSAGMTIEAEITIPCQCAYSERISE